MKQVSFTVRASPDAFERVLATLSRNQVEDIKATAVPGLPNPYVSLLRPLKGHGLRVSLAPPPVTFARIGPLVFRFEAIAKEWAARRLTEPVDLGEAVRFALVDLGTGSTVVTAEWEESTPFAPLVQRLVDEARNVYSAAEPGEAVKRKARKWKVGIKTEERAKLYKAIKDAHPEYGYETVAQKANDKEQTDTHTGETVRNTYRAMYNHTKNDCWKWERAGRVR